MTMQGELLWPEELVSALARQEGMDWARIDALLSRVYGDIPRRTRLRVDEVCARLACDAKLIYRHRDSGELACVRVGSGPNGQWRVYRAGLIAFLVRREFGAAPSRTDVSEEDMLRLQRAAAAVRRRA